MKLEKNQEYIVDIIDDGYQGEGIAKIDNVIVFVQGAIKGEKCRILIVKVNKDYAYGKILEIIDKSIHRKETDCCTYKRCGGCDLRHINYDYTLKMKQSMVQNLVNKSSIDVKVEETIGMENPYNYRNKLQYPIRNGKDGNAEMGVFAKRTHEIIPINTCFIQNGIAQQVANEVLNIIKKEKIEPYNEINRSGKIRHVVVKIGVHTNEIMCIIVTNSVDIGNEKTLVSRLISKFPNIKTIIKNVNSKNTNVILGNENEILYGDGYIHDKLGKYVFKISPMSFYQTNPIQTEILYNKVIEYAEFNENDIVCDLYCGIGTIGIFVSEHVKKVYGIEIVEQAIQDANENVKCNKIDNVEFILGDVEEAFEKMLEEKKINPSVIIVDPPRRGLDDNTIRKLLEIKTKKIIYVSCNPATMVRDMKLMEKHYEVKAIQPVDMFPFTSHVECVAVLNLK